ncbi:MAG TPA: alpha/beta hydrolase [Polyangiaceae bacterium]|jgi:pimeloyl-ACP methyl ester carboxylesterase|nr:alpha/beta hydrolase [Polyangiaceae bacterium]
MPFATGPGGARIYYEVHGTRGPAAILIQGLGLSSRFWFGAPERLAAGPDPWRAITPDHRGVGKSDRPRGRYSMRLFADDIAAVLDDARVDRAYVVGISLGGMIAQHVALRHPSRVAGLVLIATTAGFPHVRPPTARALARFLALPLGGKLRKRDIDPSFARLLLAERDVARAAELLAGWPAALETERTSLLVYAAHFAALLGHSTGAHLERIRCPTVILTGDDDILLPNENSRLLARLLPGAHLEVVPGGHIVPASDPECVRRALDRARAMAGDGIDDAVTRATG